MPPEPCAEGLALPVYKLLSTPAGGPGQYCPNSHNLQDPSPALLYLPAGQYVQPAAPAKLNVPAGQVWGEVEPWVRQ